MKRKYWIIAGALIPLVLIVAALLSLPEPDYEVVAEGDGYEVRRYQPVNVAETRVDGPFEAASDAAYEVLVGYIQGGNQGGRNLPMMAPVLQQHAEALAERDWIFRFIMPKEYPSSYLPPPVDARVELRTLPGRTLAALRYGGGWGEARYRRHEAELLEALRADGLTPIGEPAFARYNTAFTPGFLRRNEVLVEVEDPEAPQ